MEKMREAIAQDALLDLRTDVFKNYGIKKIGAYQND